MSQHTKYEKLIQAVIFVIMVLRRIYVFNFFIFNVWMIQFYVMSTFNKNFEIKL